MTSKEEHEQIKTRKLEIEQEIFKLKREDAELDQKLITIKAKHPDLFQHPPSPNITGHDLEKRMQEQAERNKPKHW